MSTSMELLANARQVSNKFKLPCIVATTDGVCEKEPIRSHNMQENGILSLLAQKGHVYMLGEKTKDDSNFIFDLKKVGIKKATSIFQCLCKEHDKQLFAEIEDKTYIGTEQQNYQFALKSIINAYYNKMRACDIYHQNVAILKEKPPYIPFVDIIFEDRDKYEKEITSFWDILSNNDYSQLLTYTIKFSHRISCAASVSINIERKFDGNLFGKENENYPLLHISVFPTKNGGYLIISTLKENEDYFNLFKNQFILLSEKSIEKYMSILLPILAEDIVISPKTVESWSARQQKEILSIFDLRAASFYHNNGIAIQSWAKDVSYNLFDA